MKKLMLLIIVAVFCTTSTVFAQLDQYVDEVRGDTLVINSYQDMGGEPNSLLNAIDEDTDAPEGRVYELKRQGWYPLLETLSSPEDRGIEIVGQAPGPMVQGTEDDGIPALISGIDTGDANLNGNMISVQNDVTLKNLSMVTADNEGGVGFQWFNTQSPNRTITLDNVIGEHTNWVFIDSNDAVETNVRIRDSYFVNMTGETCRRNGGVYDNVNNNTNSIVVENTTHVMGAGVTYKMRSFPVYEVYFNHNTFVNIAGQVLASFGHQSNYIVANNLFVNANVQAYIPGLDVAEFDQDYLPHGLINIDSLRTVNEEGEERFTIDSTWVTDNYDVSVEEFGPDDRKVLVTNNGIYWDERMYDIPQILNDNDVPCPVNEDGESEEGSDCQDPDDEWVTQAITMNSRTQAMFDDDATYPYLQEQDWIEGGDPQFTDPDGLLSDDVIQDLIDWSVDAAGIEPGMILPHWRDNSLEDAFIYPDFPVKADLSYSNSEYLNGGLNGFPLGDLNWFPEEKEAWLEIDERSELENMLNTPTSNEEYVNRPVEIQLDQNYPNPFNPTTEISFTLPESQELTLKVFDMLGREVATIANNELFSAGQNNITFDAGNLASGVYIYRLTSNDVTLSKKMTLIK